MTLCRQCLKNNLMSRLEFKYIIYPYRQSTYSTVLYVYCIWPDIYRCICSRRDRLGFYAEIQIIFGTVRETYIHELLVWSRSLAPQSPALLQVTGVCCNTLAEKLGTSDNK